MALLGVFLCYVYEKTGRITVPIAIHFLFNLSQTAIMISYRSPG
jgi:membrane protease YdiL (CAAX protease family)